MEKSELDSYIKLYNATLANIKKLGKKECENILRKLANV